ncbi:unnamed protein product, partial [Prorocentrum cordatum]
GRPPSPAWHRRERRQRATARRRLRAAGDLDKLKKHHGSSPPSATASMARRGGAQYTVCRSCNKCTYDSTLAKNGWKCWRCNELVKLSRQSNLTAMCRSISGSIPLKI